MRLLRESYNRMGLREKVALVLVAVISQAAGMDCAPQSRRKNPFNFGNKFVQTSCGKRNIAQNEVFASPNIYKKFNFPEVEYPADTSRKESIFKSGHICPKQESTDKKYDSAFLTNLRKETRRKRKSKKLIKNSIESEHTLQDIKSLQPSYFMHEIGAFPEVEYPLSAKDTWVPKYWNTYNTDVKSDDYVYETKQNTIQKNTNTYIKPSGAKGNKGIFAVVRKPKEKSNRDLTTTNANKKKSSNTIEISKSELPLKTNNELNNTRRSNTTAVNLLRDRQSRRKPKKPATQRKDNPYKKVTSKSSKPRSRLKSLTSKTPYSNNNTVNDINTNVTSATNDAVLDNPISYSFLTNNDQFNNFDSSKSVLVSSECLSTAISESQLPNTLSKVSHESLIQSTEVIEDEAILGTKTKEINSDHIKTSIHPESFRDKLSIKITQLTDPMRLDNPIIYSDKNSEDKDNVRDQVIKDIDTPTKIMLPLSGNIQDSPMYNKASDGISPSIIDDATSTYIATDTPTSIVVVPDITTMLSDFVLESVIDTTIPTELISNTLPNTYNALDFMTEDLTRTPIDTTNTSITPTPESIPSNNTFNTGADDFKSLFLDVTTQLNEPTILAQLENINSSLFSVSLDIISNNSNAEVIPIVNTKSSQKLITPESFLSDGIYKDADLLQSQLAVLASSELRALAKTILAQVDPVAKEYEILNSNTPDYQTDSIPIYRNPFPTDYVTQDPVEPDYVDNISLFGPKPSIKYEILDYPVPDNLNDNVKIMRGEGIQPTEFVMPDSFMPMATQEALPVGLPDQHGSIYPEKLTTPSLSSKAYDFLNLQSTIDPSREIMTERYVMTPHSGVTDVFPERSNNHADSLLTVKVISDLTALHDLAKNILTQVGPIQKEFLPDIPAKMTSVADPLLTEYDLPDSPIPFKFTDKSQTVPTEYVLPGSFKIYNDLNEELPIPAFEQTETTLLPVDHGVTSITKTIPYQETLAPVNFSNDFTDSKNISNQYNINPLAIPYEKELLPDENENGPISFEIICPHPTLDQCSDFNQPEPGVSHNNTLPVTTLMCIISGKITENTSSIPEISFVQGETLENLSSKLFNVHDSKIPLVPLLTDENATSVNISIISNFSSSLNDIKSHRVINALTENPEINIGHETLVDGTLTQMPNVTISNIQDYETLTERKNNETLSNMPGNTLLTTSVNKQILNRPKINTMLNILESYTQLEEPNNIDMLYIDTLPNEPTNTTLTVSSNKQTLSDIPVDDKLSKFPDEGALPNNLDNNTLIDQLDNDKMSHVPNYDAPFDKQDNETLSDVLVNLKFSRFLDDVILTETPVNFTKTDQVDNNETTSCLPDYNTLLDMQDYEILSNNPDNDTLLKFPDDDILKEMLVNYILNDRLENDTNSEIQDYDIQLEMQDNETFYTYMPNNNLLLDMPKINTISDILKSYNLLDVPNYETLSIQSDNNSDLNDEKMLEMLEKYTLLNKSNNYDELNNNSPSEIPEKEPLQLSNSISTETDQEYTNNNSSVLATLAKTSPKFTPTKTLPGNTTTETLTEKIPTETLKEITSSGIVTENTSTKTLAENTSTDTVPEKKSTEVQVKNNSAECTVRALSVKTPIEKVSGIDHNNTQPKEKVTKKILKNIFAETLPDNNPTETLSENTSIEILSEKTSSLTMPKNISTKTSENICTETLPEKTSNEIIPENISTETLPENSLTEIAYENTNIETDTIEIINKNTTTETVSENTSTQAIIENNPTAIISEKMVSDNTTSQTLLKNTSNKRLSENNPTETLSESPSITSCEKISGNTGTETVSDIILNKPLLEKTSSEIIPENISTETLPDNTLTEIVTENLSAKILPRNIPDKVLSKNTSARLLSENTPIEIVFHITPTETVAKNTLTETLLENTDNTLTETSIKITFTETLTENRSIVAASKNSQDTTLTEITPFETLSENTFSKKVPGSTPNDILVENTFTETLPKNNFTETLAQYTSHVILPESTTIETVPEKTSTEKVSENNTTLSENTSTETLSEDSPTETLAEKTPTKKMLEYITTETLLVNTSNKKMLEKTPSEILTENFLSQTQPDNILTKSLLETNSDALPYIPDTKMFPDMPGTNVLLVLPETDVLPDLPDNNVLPHKPGSKSLPKLLPAIELLPDKLLTEELPDRPDMPRATPLSDFPNTDAQLYRPGIEALPDIPDTNILLNMHNFVALKDKEALTVMIETGRLPDMPDSDSLPNTEVLPEMLYTDTKAYMFDTGTLPDMFETDTLSASETLTDTLDTHALSYLSNANEQLPDMFKKDILLDKLDTDLKANMFDTSTLPDMFDTDTLPDTEALKDTLNTDALPYLLKTDEQLPDIFETDKLPNMLDTDTTPDMFETDILPDTEALTDTLTYALSYLPIADEQYPGKFEIHTLPDKLDTDTIADMLDTSTLPNIFETDTLPATDALTDTLDTDALPDLPNADEQFPDMFEIDKLPDTEASPNMLDTETIADIYDTSTLPDMFETDTLPDKKTLPDMLDTETIADILDTGTLPDMFETDTLQDTEALTDTLDTDALPYLPNADEQLPDMFETDKIPNTLYTDTTTDMFDTDALLDTGALTDTLGTDALPHLPNAHE